MSEIKSVTTNDFETNVLNSDVPVVVDFWAEWCGPCKALAPVLDEVAQEVTGKANIVKVNIDADENRDLAAKYGVRGIPTLIFFKNGQAEKTLVGNLPKAEILKSITELI